MGAQSEKVGDAAYGTYDDIVRGKWARGLQIGDETRHRRAAEAGLAGDVGTADRTPLTEGVDHAQAIALAQGLERAGPQLTHGATLSHR